MPKQEQSKALTTHTRKLKQTRNIKSSMPGQSSQEIIQKILAWFYLFLHKTNGFKTKPHT